MKNVLIVDDEKSLLLSLSAGFESFKDKFTLYTASNGIEALAVLKSTPIELVVTDLKMPEMDGFELIAHMSTHYPQIKLMVMTAYNTPKIEERLSGHQAIPIFEKPVDFDELAQAVLQGIDGKKTGGLSGISLVSFLQLIKTERKSCLIEVKTKDHTGHIIMKKGELINAVYNGEEGVGAMYGMLEEEDVQIELLKLPQHKIKREITMPLMGILFEAMKRKDDAASAETSDTVEPEPDDDTETIYDLVSKVPPGDAPNVDSDPHSVINGTPASLTSRQKKGVDTMSEIASILEKLKSVEGFMATGIFSPEGELIQEVKNASIKLDEVGALANDILLKAQKSTEIMGVGRGKMVHIEAPKAHILVRCLNESTDFSQTTTGRAHIHMVVIIEKEGSFAMAKMKLASLIQELAPLFR
ncbi:hypothetical protein DSLASN_19930 [Desulfoluna limicola]|uniref:Response regulatory domain-containing protein n=1 Tax=Desulfoluna limicola TaxID=2810562 RepID=A0ABN6F423_9BACT|nr:response regulator [Desulfoluna limicola]BCS96361.1 hypothetical protein DSLASN_19930 [Desulfoluna limicola]